MYKIVKRIMDIMVALIFSIILLPIFIIIFVAIKIEDGGPIFYHQIRTGKNGKKPFLLCDYCAIIYASLNECAPIGIRNDSTT